MYKHAPTTGSHHRQDGSQAFIDVPKMAHERSHSVFGSASISIRPPRSTAGSSQRWRSVPLRIPWARRGAPRAALRGTRAEPGGVRSIDCR